jgi:glycosyltransferase involved in cell wall biosynthesis
MISAVSHSLPARRRIGLDAHLLSLTENYRGAGINGHIYQLLRHLPAVDRPYDYQAYLYDPRFRTPELTPPTQAGLGGESPSGEPGPVASLAVRRSRWDTRRPWRRILWEQTALAAESRKLDLLHGLAFAAPLMAACPTVITVHDLSFLRYPGAFRPFNRWYLSWITRTCTRRAARVIAVSESTRQDVIRLCGVAPERVVNIPNGVTAGFSPASTEAVAAFRQVRGLPDRYMLFLGTLEPRKNLVRLIEAYGRWRQGRGGPAAKLVIAGGKGWYYERIYARVAELGLLEDVIFPGYVPAEDLPWWYRAADLFIYPSLFEGFGLPVLEALACGTPTIASCASSLPEVAGEAALLVDPDDVQALAQAIEWVMSDRQVAATLRAAGPEQAARFPWSRTARETVQLYRDVLEEAPR